VGLVRAAASNVQHGVLIGSARHREAQPLCGEALGRGCDYMNRWRVVRPDEQTWGATIHSVPTTLRRPAGRACGSQHIPACVRVVDILHSGTHGRHTCHTPPPDRLTHVAYAHAAWPTWADASHKICCHWDCMMSEVREQRAPTQTPPDVSVSAPRCVSKEGCVVVKIFISGEDLVWTGRWAERCGRHGS